MRREAAHHPGGYRGRRSTGQHDDHEAAKRIAVSPGDGRVAQAVRMGKRNPEYRSGHARHRADGQRDQRELQQPATVVGGFFAVIRASIHRRLAQWRRIVLPKALAVFEGDQRTAMLRARLLFAVTTFS
jgi:hypothetical protein